MASAAIIFQQNLDGYAISCSRDDLALNLPVTMLNQDNTGVTTWLWTMLDRPVGSSAAIVTPTASTTTFTPDVIGTYLIKLIVNGGEAFQKKGAAVKTINLLYRIPAATETTEFDGYRGWARDVNFALQQLDDGYAVRTYPTIIDNTNLELTTLLATNVVTYTPPATGDYVIYIYYRVITGATVTQINVSWTDSSGAQTFAALVSGSQVIGSYMLAPIYITATSSGAITVQALASTINQVFVSASILGLISSPGQIVSGPIEEKSNIFDVELTTINPTNVISFTPLLNGNFTGFIYYRVANAPTDVTIDASWNDISGAQTLSIIPLTNKTVGSYTISPFYLQATTAANINLTITAGTANNVFVSATIISV